MAKAFLETGENSRLVAGLDIDHPPGRQPGLGKRGREKILPRDTPQDASPRSGSDAGGPEGGRGAVDGSVGAARDLVQRPKGQPPSRQYPVDRGDAEGQDLTGACRCAFEARDALPKFG